MNLLSELEGRSGEALTSAALRFLILRSQDARETLRDLISESSYQGPIVMQHEFSCRLEVQTKESISPSEQSSTFGRIDLLLQTDNAIIGIENKLDANFQPGQPEKYREKLEQLAKSQDKQYVLVILAPADRNKEIEKMVRSLEHRNHYIQLDWENTLDHFKKSVQTNSDRISQTLVDQLNDYIITTRGTLWPKELRAKHLQGPFKPQGVQGEFIRKMRSILPAASNIGTGKANTGYHLEMSRESEQEGSYNTWFGFVSSDILIDSKNPSELVLATSRTSASPPKHLREIRMKSPWWKPMSAWAIDITDDRKWKEPDTWRELIRFLF